MSVPATSARASLRAPNAGDSERSSRAAQPIDIGPGGRTRISGRGATRIRSSKAAGLR